MNNFRRTLSLLLCLLMLLSLIPAAAFAGEDLGEDFPPEYVQEESDNDNANENEEGDEEGDPESGNGSEDDDDPDSGSGAGNDDDLESGSGAGNDDDPDSGSGSGNDDDLESGSGSGNDDDLESGSGSGNDDDLESGSGSEDGDDPTDGEEFFQTRLGVAFRNGGSSVASGTCGANLIWTLDTDGLLTISGEGAMNDFDFPSTSAWHAYKDDIVSVEIESGVTSIGELAFFLCQNIKDVTFPEGLTSIGINAFNSCSSLESVTFPSSLTSIESGAFANCNGLLSIEIPENVINIDPDALNNTSLTSILVNENNQSYSDLDGVLFNKLQTELVCFPGGRSGNYSIPESVITIGDCAFYNCKSMQSITIPESVTTIGSSAFSHCESLQSITIPGNVTTIGGSAFSYCISLVSVMIPGEVTTIDQFTFGWCTSLTNVIIPEGVKTISHRAFYYCSALTSITIPKSLESIGVDSFFLCSDLTDVYYAGTEEEWQNITIDSSNNYSLASATIHYNSTGPAPASYGRISTISAEASDSMTLRLFVKDIPDTITPVFQVVLGDDNGRVLTQSSDDNAYALSKYATYVVKQDQANGRWEIDVKVYAKWLSSAFTLRMYDADTTGDPLPIKGYALLGIGDDSIAAEHAYSILDYFNMLQTYTGADKDIALYNALSQYGSVMAQYWR